MQNIDKAETQWNRVLGITLLLTLKTSSASEVMTLWCYTSLIIIIIIIIIILSLVRKSTVGT